MHILRRTLDFLIILCVVVIAACSADKPHTNPSGTIGSETTSTGQKKLAKLEGPEIVVSNAVDDQQNPQVIYLPDRNIYFSVWEDWRNRNTTGSDIYGQFINPDGTMCGSAFPITQAANNQTVPTAVYRQVNGNPAAGKIVVAWQDERGSSTSGYVYFSTITSLPTGGSCDAVAPVVSAETPIGFNGTLFYGNNFTVHDKYLIATGDGTKTQFSVMLAPYVDPTSIVVTATIGGQLQSLFGDGKGGLSGIGVGAGVVNPVTGALSVTFLTAPDAGTDVTVNYTTINISATSPMNDKLLSRQQPKISYDASRDRFWITWNESRDQVNSYSDLCFDILPVNKNFGDGVYAGYIMLDGAAMTPLINSNNVAGADIVRNAKTRKNRLIAKGDPTFTPQTFEYEFFTNINNVAVASDSTAPETLLAWEGIRQKISFTCTSDPATGIIKVAYTDPAPADDGRVHVYSMFDKTITQPSQHAMQLDTGNTTAKSSYPALAFDPVSHRFLAAWEDLRNGPYTKIYGQLLYSGGGLYNTNTLISYQDSTGTGQQDTNVANSRQTRPFISYDAVNQRFFVAWQDGRNGTYSLENLDIYGQYVDTEGSLRGSNYAISTAPDSQLAPSLAYNNATDATGKQFLAMWKDARNRNITGSDIYGQRFSLGQPQMMLLKADGTTPLSPLLIDFGSLPVNQLDRITFVIKNTGDTSLAVDCADTASPNTMAAPFSFENLPTQLGTCGDGQTLTLVPSSSTVLTVKFQPTTGGTFNGSFTLKSDAGNSTVNLQGIGIPPTMAITESDGTNNGTLDYGSVVSGQNKDLTLTITNNSTVSYNITSITNSGTSFAVTNAPSFPLTLASGASTTITVRFSPSVEGSATGQLTINTDRSLTQQINLSGTGLAAGTTTPPPTSGTGSNTGTTTTSGTGTSTAPPAAGGGGGCFIATAAFGSYLDPHVMVLRHFRDDVLLKSRIGTAFVKLYYHTSPPIADFIRAHDTLRTATRWLLTPLIFAVEYTGVFIATLLALAFIGRVGYRRMKNC